ncbi:MAG: hypothetical protein AMXMBFR82_10950 [Candidatus Hydrogenedentota bacterium]
MTTDAALLEQWQRRRDAEAFAELVHRHSGMVISSCKRIVRDPALAEDVAQECFIALMQSRDAVRSSLGAWLHTIAVRRSIDRLKGEKRRRQRESDYAAAHDAHESQDVSVGEIIAHVDEAIASLPENYRVAVVGRLLENRTHTEMAAELGVSESAIRYRVEQGVERVRQTLQRKGVAATVAGFAAVLSTTAEAAPAHLVARLSKLAMSGSISSTGAGVLSAAIAGKVAIGVAGVILALAASWYVFTAPNSAPEPASPSRPADASRVAAKGEETVTEVVPESAPNQDVQRLAAAPAQQTEPFSIRGRVYDAKTGDGIAGVRANVYPAGGGGHVARSNPTDENGRYSIPPIQDGMYSVSLEDIERYPDPRGSQRVSVKLTNHEPVSDVDFALTPGIPVSGLVVDANGQPVNGAEVVAAIPTTPNPIRGASDGEGAFTIYLPEISDQLQVQAQTENAESQAEGAFPLPEEGLEGVVLMLDRPKSASIRGTVLDASGAPMSGAQLHLLRTGSDVLRYGPSGEADGDGRFFIEGLVSTEFGIIVTPKGVNGFSSAEEYARIRPEPGETIEGFEIVYGEKGGMAVAGRVVDSAGEPVERARVMCFADGGMESTYTDGDGMFMVTGLEDKVYGITVEHEDYSRGSGRFAARTMDAEIILKGRGNLAGRVIRAETGEPLSAYTLAFVMGEVHEFNETLYGSGSPIESADGAFSIGQMQVGTYTVAAWAPGYAPVLQHVEVEENESSNAEFMLATVPSFEGIVVNETGEPVANAAVYFVTGVSLDRIDRAAAVRSDTRGHFTIGGLPRDAKRVCAYHPGYGAGVTEVPGEGRIVLPESAAVTGAIQSGNLDVGRLFINAYYSDAPHLPGASLAPDRDGAFRLADLSEGMLSINVTASGANSRSVTKTLHIEPGKEAHVDIVFKRGTATVEGTLITDGEPVDYAFLSLERRTGDTVECVRATAGLDGGFRFEDVWAGRLVLKISRFDPDNLYEPIVNEVDLAVIDGQVSRQDIKLPPIR